MPTHVMTPDDIDAFCRIHFPDALELVQTVSVGDGHLTVRLDANSSHLRPGGTISGPTLMAMADTAMWFLTLSLVGPEPLTVTTQLNMSFLRRAPPGSLQATASLLKLGRTLVVGHVVIGPEGGGDPIAHAQVTYARPPPTRSVRG